MRKKSENGIKIVVIGIILICLVLGYYYYLSNKKTEEVQEEQVTLTEVQEMLLYNFDKNYPPTPKEVVKLFGQMVQCVYNEEYTEDEFYELAMQVQNLYDAELIANKTEDQYLNDLRTDIEQMKDQQIVISSYSPSASTDVDYFSEDGYDWAKLYCSFTLRKGTELGISNEIFLLRKDEEGHWKIYGWTLAENE